MWARVMEAMVACWLAMSPFIFRHGDGETLHWATDLGAAAVVIFLSTSSFWDRMRAAHLGNVAVALWLVGVGYFAAPWPPLPADQNELIVGIVLFMLAVLPTEAGLPPRAWQRWYRERARGGEGAGGSSARGSGA